MTLMQVAKEAGVSITTASKVFNDVPTVRPYIRERVLETAKKLNYHPNQLARGLRNRYANLVSLGIQLLDNPFFGDFTQTLSGLLLEQGLGAIICNNIDKVNEVNRSSRACGTILVSPSKKHIEEVVQERALVTITASKPMLDLAPDVSIDFSRAYTETATRLLDIKKHHFVFLGWTEADWTVNLQSKFCHMLNVLEDEGFEKEAVNPKYFSSPAQIIDYIKVQNQPVDAVVCCNDLIASHLTQYLWMNDIAPGRDVIVVGCDGCHTIPGIWTVKISISALASAASYLLKQQLDKGDYPSQITVSPTLALPEKID